jgi:hypothetical protein
VSFNTPAPALLAARIDVLGVYFRVWQFQEYAVAAEIFKSTKAWRIFNSYRTTIEQIAKEKPSVAIEPLQKLNAYIEIQLNTLDPDLVTPGQLAQLQQHFANANGEANTLNSDSNSAHVEQIRNHLASAIPILLTLPKVASSDDIQAAYASVLEYTRSASSGILQALNASVEELAASASAARTEFARLSENVEALKARTDGVVAEFQKQFSDNENTRAQRLEEVVKKLQEEGEQHFADFEKTELELREKFVADAGAVLKTLQARDEETLRLALAMGAKGLSSSFQATANKNEKAADYLRAGAIFLLVALVGFVAWALTEPSIEQTLMRFGAALLFGIPAAYLARESSRQRAEAVRSRRIELELSALGPFIENLDVASKGEVRKQLVATYFGKAFDREQDQGDSLQLGGTVIELFKVLRDAGKK